MFNPINCHILLLDTFYINIKFDKVTGKFHFSEVTLPSPWIHLPLNYVYAHFDQHYKEQFEL